MTEEKKKKQKEKLIINIVDGVPCIYLPPGIIVKELPPPQIIPFSFGNVQEFRTSEVMPDILKELQNIFKDNHWGFTKIELPPPKKKEKEKEKEEEEEEENDNEE